MKFKYAPSVFVLLLIMMAVCVPTLVAEEMESKPRSFEEFPESLGLFVGLNSGIGGLSYHSWLPNAPGSGVQVVAGVLYTPGGEGNFYGNYILDYNVGFEYQQSVFGADFVEWLSGQLYLWAGLSHRGFSRAIRDSEDYETVTTGPYNPTVAIGIGIGVEIILFRHFSFPIEVGYGGTYNFIADSFANGISVGLTFQGGGRYRY